MKRYQLFEFEDFAWFPKLLRDYMTDYLRTITETFDMFAPTVPLLADLLQRTGHTRVVDLASGGGGTWRRLAPALQREVPALQVQLTDLYPNVQALGDTVSSHPEIMRFEPEPMDARAVSPELTGVRTQFLSLHHLAPADVRAMLHNAVAAGQPVAIFEAQQRDLKHVLQFMFSPLFVWLLTPLIRPFRWSRLLLTYVIPAVPFFVLWDGVVSALRTYTPAEMLEMANAADAGSAFEWDAGVLQAGPVKIPYLLGWPDTHHAV